MADYFVEETYRRIRQLRIQGAINIAIAGVEAVAASLSRNPAALGENMKLLESARATEPALRNSFSMIRQVMKKGGNGKAVCARILFHLRGSRQPIASCGAGLVKNRMTVLTHCHSSTAVAILRQARGNGRRFRVYSTETRPRFQGRTTASELSELGIPTTMIVDSAANFFMHEAGLFLVGCDAINYKGDLFNKIGTSMIALSAREHKVPLYSATSLFKFDPATRKRPEPIEEREPSEVAMQQHFPKVKIRNPAFDKTPAKFVKGYITEAGIVRPRDVEKKAKKFFKSILKSAL